MHRDHIPAVLMAIVVGLALAALAVSAFSQTAPTMPTIDGILATCHVQEATLAWRIEQLKYADEVLAKKDAEIAELKAKLEKIPPMDLDKHVDPKISQVQ